MSQQFRPAVGSQPTMGSRMMSPNCPTSHLPGVMPVLPNPYTLVTAHPQYISHPPFTHNMQNIPTNQMPVLTAVRGPIHGMYVPVAPLNPGISPMNVDPAKLLEEQRKLEKERNFQLQQQRLKQFTVAGKKGSLNADNLIDSMFGKTQPKQSTAPPSSFGEFVESKQSFSTPTPNFESAQSHMLQAAVVNQEVHKNVSQKPVIKDKKELDAMMQECSDLKSGPQKGHTFSKPAVRELAPTTQQRSTFTASDKARDWKNLQGFEEVFVANKPRFPEWCKKESVPELYRQIEAFVTSNGANAPDTKLLFPILISSGLPRQTLGQIWELVNQSAPGYLTAEEMYAALALIAVTQAGHPVKTVDILHQLPACPIPQLQCFAPQPTADDQPTKSLQQAATNETAQVDAANKDAKTHQVLRPSAISLKPNTSSASGSVAPTNIDLSGSGFISSPDDDFDDFKSATPTAVNFSMNTPSSVWTQGNDDFDDFQQAPPTFPSANQHIETATTNKLSRSNLTETKFSNPILPQSKVPVLPLSDHKIPVPPLSENKIPVPSLSESKFPSLVMAGQKGSLPLLSENKSTVPIGKQSTPIPPISQDLMSPEEDKYSVFRSLQQTEELDEWGDFSSVTTNDMRSVNQTDVDESSQSNTPTFPSEFLKNPAPISNVQTNSIDFFQNTSETNVIANDLFGMNQSNDAKENDDFGDFLHAEAAPTNVDAVTNKLGRMSTNFADFSNFKEPAAPSTFPPQLDDEFGDFASSVPVKSELGHEFVFQHVKDNISLAESQSVSSLELGTFDGGGHSGESKSSLSRQGSIPSLDLKNGGVEVADGDEFGEFQSPAFVRASKTPSPAKDLKVNGSTNTSNNSFGLSFQNTRNAPLIDKYSVIRSEERKDEDQHISCWIRCLQSSVNILQNTKKILNQMSCSSVCNEVLKSEEGENYIKDVIEVYKVISRIAVASKASGKQTIPILDLLKEANQSWNTISGFFAGSALMPDESSLEFSNAVLSSNCEDNTQACGLCLLNIDIKSKSKEESLKLSYGGRNYHSTCANLWVNCVDRLLPALPLPQLL